MMDSQAARFATLAESEAGLLGDFVEVLEQERTALRAAQPEALVALSSRKSVLAEDLADIARQRSLVLGGTGAERAELRRVLDAHPQVRATWDRVLSLARRASDLNTGNGFLVNQRLASVARALEAMGAGRATLYDPRGSSSGSAASRSFGCV